VPALLFKTIMSTHRVSATRVSGGWEAPSRIKVDLGNRLANTVVDSFVNVGLVGAAHGLAKEGLNQAVGADNAKQFNFEKTAKDAARQGLEWGAISALYTGVNYGLEQARDGRRDWVNSLAAGAITGALYAASTDDGRGNDKVAQSALTGAALATAAEFLRDL
jgi:hypothetical protein